MTNHITNSPTTKLQKWMYDLKLHRKNTPLMCKFSTCAYVYFICVFMCVHVHRFGSKTDVLNGEKRRTQRKGRGGLRTTPTRPHAVASPWTPRRSHAGSESGPRRRNGNTRGSCWSHRTNFSKVKASTHLEVQRVTAGSPSSLTASSSRQTLTGLFTLNCQQQRAQEDTKLNPAVTKQDTTSANYKTTKTKEPRENRSRFLQAARTAPVLEAPGPLPCRKEILSAWRASSLTPRLDGNLSWTSLRCPARGHWWVKVTSCFTPLPISPWVL